MARKKINGSRASHFSSDNNAKKSTIFYANAYLVFWIRIGIHPSISAKYAQYFIWRFVWAFYRRNNFLHLAGI
jgi:hypothetical protein